MKAKGKSNRSGYVTMALFAVAAVLLIFSATQSSRAALTYFSETYGAEVSMRQIGVTLVENGAGISNRDYLGSDDQWDDATGRLVSAMLKPTEGKLRLNHDYQEELSVTNSGVIDEYVRVTIYRYWERDGKKLTTLSPGLIDLNILQNTGWVLDGNSTTDERTVLYWPTILPAGESTNLFADTLTIREAEGDGFKSQMRTTVTTRVVSDENGRKVVETVYDYDGIEFVLRVDVDAVQTHNAEDAIRSAWGIEMSDYGIR